MWTKRTRKLRTVLANHFGNVLTKSTSVGDVFERADLPNFQNAIDETIAADGWSVELVGPGHYSLPMLVVGDSYGRNPPRETTVNYEIFHLGEDDSVTCVINGIWLLRRANICLAVEIKYQYSDDDQNKSFEITVLAIRKEDAEGFLQTLRDRLRSGANVFRGRALSYTKGQFGTGLRVHKLPSISPDEIILPADLLRRIERTTVDFSKHADELRAAGRHLKRGILLHGPPGTGKTLTAMYLASQMTERTVIMLTGESLAKIDRMCRLARLLQPSTVIMEDVDLVAEERTSSAPGCTSLLFELLNQMDGLAEDADVLFLLTTNRPDLLEPALAARPGRIDQAIEVPLPDADCRRRLFELYAIGLDCAITDWKSSCKRTEGVSAAFIRELMRKSALIAIMEGKPVATQHVEAALEELLVVGGPLTRNLLGASKAGFLT